jgi:hypothetical protein
MLPWASALFCVTCGIALQNGTVGEQGTYEVLKAANGDFAAFLEEYMSQAAQDEHNESKLSAEAVRNRFSLGPHPYGSARDC